MRSRRCFWNNQRSQESNKPYRNYLEGLHTLRGIFPLRANTAFQSNLTPTASPSQQAPSRPRSRQTVCRLRFPAGGQRPRILPGVADAVHAGGDEGDHGLSGKVVRLHKGVDDRRFPVPPHREADEYDILTSCAAYLPVFEILPISGNLFVKNSPFLPIIFYGRARGTASRRRPSAYCQPANKEQRL